MLIDDHGSAAPSLSTGATTPSPTHPSIHLLLGPTPSSTVIMASNDQILEPPSDSISSLAFSPSSSHLLVSSWDGVSPSSLSHSPSRLLLWLSFLVSFSPSFFRPTFSSCLCPTHPSSPPFIIRTVDTTPQLCFCPSPHPNQVSSLARSYPPLVSSLHPTSAYPSNLTSAPFLGSSFEQVPTPSSRPLIMLLK